MRSEPTAHSLWQDKRISGFRTIAAVAVLSAVAYFERGTEIKQGRSILYANHMGRRIRPARLQRVRTARIGGGGAANTHNARAASNISSQAKAAYECHMPIGMKIAKYLQS